MSGGQAASAPNNVLGFMGDLCGMPVRLTMLDPETPERTLRAHGVVAQVKASGLFVDCMRSVPPLRSGVSVSVEVMVAGSLIWFQTSIETDAPTPAVRGQIHLTMPETIQTLQRRRHPRVDVDVAIRLVLQRTGESISARVRDLSAGGAALEMAEPIAAGEPVVLEFPMTSGMFFRDPAAETLRCTDAQGGMYTVAVQFACAPEQEARIAAWVNRQIENQVQGSRTVTQSEG